MTISATQFGLMPERACAAGFCRAVHRAPRTGPLAALAVLVTGCSPAPSQNILGSFFPAWILCAALGVVIALVCRRVLSIAGIGAYLVAAPLVYLALAAGAALLIWLIQFGG